eukprot:1148579-Pelagomonas_calceolata.AAC.8
MKNWRDITYTDDSVTRHKDESPPLVSWLRGFQTKQTLLTHPNKSSYTLKPNELGTTNRADLAGILVAYSLSTPTRAH